MATRASVRDSFVDELRSAAATTHTVTYGDGSTTTVTLSDDDVRLQDPEGLEVLPGVVYTENYSRLDINGAGSGPDNKTFNADGSVDEEVWREYVEAQFVVEVRAGSDVEKEPIYEAVRQQFQRYNFAPWPESDFHSDAFHIEVRDASSTDVGAAEDRIRGDQIEVYVQFHRDYTLSTDNIEQFNHTIEGISFTTT